MKRVGKATGHQTTRGGAGQKVAALLVTGLVMALMLLGVTTAGATVFAAGSAQPPVGLGTAGTFAVLAGQTITNTGASAISGNVGLYPGSAIAGFPPGTVSNGTEYAADTVAQQAQAALTTAYNDAAGRTPVTSVAGGLLGGQTLAPGVYGYTSGLALTGTVTLDGGGNPGAVFIFQAGSTLVTASGSTVQLTGGAQACNVFWQVGSSATLGTGTTFVGTVMALTSVSVETGSTVEGRILARNGSVSLDDSAVTAPGCSTVTTTAASHHTLVLGTTVNDTATVTGNQTDGTPTGSVAFRVCGPGTTTCAPTAGTSLGTAEPLINGTATSPAFKPTAVGTYCFAAVYVPTGGVYQTSSTSGTASNGECFTVTAAAGSSGPGSSATSSPVIPPTHTGEPWAGFLYWVLAAVVGLAGLGLVAGRRYGFRSEHRNER